ncbi:MAG TPA: protein kinase [Gemmatimonadales bacterium]|nr:protein kinase [Gemmatimonadales bacterium]
MTVPDGLRAALAERYRLDSELGRGGMATVYIAEDLKHGRQVAIKVLRPEIAGGSVPERFLREIRISARLVHPQIVPLHDSGQTAGFLYYVMPYLGCESLRAKLDRERRLPVAQAVRFGRAVASALDYAHRSGVLHRDIKPENILVHEGEAVVADFGIARALSSVMSDERMVSEPGFAVGTPAYMSPEQASADAEIDGRTDIYSLACVVYEMLAGQPPFAGSPARVTMTRHVVEQAQPVRALRGEAPVALEQALARALAKNPADRFATAAEFGRALDDAIAGISTPTHEPVARPADRRAIAVLPFVNASPDPDTEYFSDGMTDELIDALTKVEGLRVASRTSVFALKRREADVRTLGALLGVAVVLEGSVRRSGSRLRVTARLTDVGDGRHLWSERFDRDAGDVFEVQDEIAGTIVRTLRGTLLGELGDPTPRRYTANLTAYNLYLKGRYCWNKRRAEGLNEAIGYFEAAIAEDPGYALAYSGLADCYALHVDYRGMPVGEAMARSRELALQALALDDTLAEAHTSLAWVTFLYDWDWEAAGRGFRRAIELNPRYATARQWYAWLLVSQGRVDAALAEARAAAELDPASVSIRRSLGWLNYYARRYEAAAEQLRRALAMDPTSEENHRILGLVLTVQGRHDEAAAAFREAIAGAGESAYARGALARALASGGHTAEARRLLTELEAESQSRYVSPVALATANIALGNTDEAFRWIERARSERRGWMAYLRVEPIFDPIRPDPRFAELLATMGLSPAGM